MYYRTNEQERTIALLLHPALHALHTVLAAQSLTSEKQGEEILYSMNTGNWKLGKRFLASAGLCEK